MDKKKKPEKKKVTAVSEPTAAVATIPVVTIIKKVAAKKPVEEKSKGVPLKSLAKGSYFEYQGAIYQLTQLADVEGKLRYGCSLVVWDKIRSMFVTTESFTIPGDALVISKNIGEIPR